MLLHYFWHGAVLTRIWRLVGGNPAYFAETFNIRKLKSLG